MHFILQVKLLKTRLRSIIEQDWLNSLMILSCERNIAISFEKGININAMQSDLLKYKLIL